MSKILINNIYHMLSYAYQVLMKDTYKNCAVEEFENIGDLLSCILVKGITAQLKVGMSKDYIEETDALSCLRGKIGVSESIKHRTMVNHKLVCTYDTFSIDEYKNQIIKTTLMILLKMDIPKMRKKEIRKILVYFQNIHSLDYHNINWKFQYNKNNQTYQMLISICFLILKGLLQSEQNGVMKLMHFFDDQRMCRLYEKFILEYYRKEHKELNVSSPQINWRLDDDEDEYLPKMQSDVMISYKGKFLIIDAKFYSRAMQESFGAKTVHSNNLYQIFTYVKNKQFEVREPVAGMLLYAKTDEDIVPDFEYKMSGNRVLVKTLDLNCQFEEIRNQLDGIVENVFGS